MYRKKILWIDDWPTAMNNMLSSVFHRLWEQDIRSEIAIFGNAALDEFQYENKVQDKKTDDLNRAVYSEFVAYLLSKSDLDVNKLGEYTSLISKKDYNEVVKGCCSDIAQNLYNKFEPLYKEYTSIEPDYNNISEDICNKLNFMAYDCILLDLRLTAYDNIFHKKVYGLLEGDEKKQYDNIKPLFSMMIYNYLKNYECEQGEKLPEVFLYSTYTEPIDFTKEWKKQYIKIYTNNEESYTNNEESIEIFNRDGKEISDKNKDLVIEISNK